MSDNLITLEMKVKSWASARGILQHSTKQAQAMKCWEETSEIAKGVNKNNRDLVMDGIGDSLVTMILLADMYDTDLTECLNMAYDEIKDRRGKMNADGVFVKEEDL